MFVRPGMGQRLVVNYLAKDDEGELACATASLGVERLYSISLAKLKPTLTKRLGSKADAEDVLHEAFVRYLAFYGGRTILNPLAMLARIALNIVRDNSRSERQRSYLLATQAGPVCAISQGPDPETLLALHQEARLLKEAIDQLPTRCREVFLLHCVDDRPHAEVARILGISRSMVEKHVMRAYARLRSQLERNGWRGVDKNAGSGS